MPPDQVTFDMPADPGRSSSATHLTGRLLPDEVFGKYKVLRMLGEGAFGRVYLALDPGLDMEVAIKVPKSKELTPEFLRRFRGEGLAAAKIRHPHVCRVLTADSTEDGRPYFVFDYIPGETLEAALKARRRLPPAEAARLMTLIARGVAAAHKAGVIHRDLKPANVLIQPDPDGDRPVVTDFGVARVVGRDAGSVDGQTIGTLAYMPAEQGYGEQHRVGPWSDVYALGVMLYEMVTGQDPYPGRLGFVEVMKRAGVPPRASDCLPAVPVGLCEVVFRAMQGEPANRYPSAVALADALDGWLATPAARVRPATAETQDWHAAVVSTNTIGAGSTPKNGSTDDGPRFKSTDGGAAATRPATLWASYRRAVLVGGTIGLLATAAGIAAFEWSSSRRGTPPDRPVTNPTPP